MVKCRAKSDGLLGGHYVHAGEEFLAPSCPRWAEVVPVEKAVKAAKAAKAAADEKAGD